MILRIILSLLFEHGKNIIGPQFGWLPSSDGANASVPRRDMHHEKAEQDILVTQQVYQRAQSDLAGSRPRAYQLKGFQQPIELYAA